MGLVLQFVVFTVTLLPLPHLGSQHHVDKALNLIGKKFKELNLTNIYAPPLPSLALPSLPMTSWVSMHLADQTRPFCLPFMPTCPKLEIPETMGQEGQELVDACDPSPLASCSQFASASSLCSLWLGFEAEVLVQNQTCLCPHLARTVLLGLSCRDIFCVFKAFA